MVDQNELTILTDAFKKAQKEWMAYYGEDKDLTYRLNSFEEFKSACEKFRVSAEKLNTAYVQFVEKNSQEENEA